jgi:membrane-associated phospholipid phosphatase
VGRTVTRRVSGDSGQVADPLLAAEWRWPAAVAVALCAAVTLALGVIVNHRHTVDGLDQAVDNWLHHSIGRHRGILTLLSLPGEPIPAAALAAALVLACLAARRWRAAALVAIAMMAASAITEFLLKHLVGRKMGAGAGSFPSGHAVGMFALAVAVCVLLAQPPRPFAPALRRMLSLVALLAATTVSLAMVALNHHYFTDIIGGAAFATAVVLLTAFALDWLAARTRTRRGPPSAGAPYARPRESAGQAVSGKTHAADRSRAFSGDEGP